VSGRFDAFEKMQSLPGAAGSFAEVGGLDLGIVQQFGGIAGQGDFAAFHHVAAEGMTILLIEQNAKLALESSQRGYVMESGEITLHGESAQLLGDPKVRAAYLGE
jgi:hypothetical protein